MFIEDDQKSNDIRYIFSLMKMEADTKRALEQPPILDTNTDSEED